MPPTEVRPIVSDDDIVRVRQAVRTLAVQLGFSLVDQTKLVTAASELARNALIYGKGGQVALEPLERNGKRGLRLSVEDRGPGIHSLELALQDGYTTGKGLGLGLGGTRRLMDEFKIDSTPGIGTKVVITKWKP